MTRGDVLLHLGAPIRRLPLTVCSRSCRCHASGGTRRPVDELPAGIEELLPRWGRLLTEPRFRILTAGLLGVGPDHPRLLQAYREHHLVPRKTRSTALLRAAVEARVLPEGTDPEMPADMMTGAILNLLLLRPEAPDTDEVVDHLRRMFRQVGLDDREPRSS
ncbi:MAG TPA: TetR/AcrR family transcriptional regulator C-terminal ligand-binding domain-containing protein [Candidatus Stackebrandtia excrementipullorum]|nr:TetR/AcrR family transcriptional regulator C-terminal ligand-binding domain-containing protein [Candidatus Stackebrandtia excrementipullorum]